MISYLDEKQRISDDVKLEHVDTVELPLQRRGWTHWLTTWDVEMRGQLYHQCSASLLLFAAASRNTASAN